MTLNKSNMDSEIGDRGNTDAATRDYLLLSPASPMTLRHADADINIKVPKVPLSPAGGYRRTFYDRAFGKLEKGSVRGSIFSLCSAAIGGGVLSLPYMLALSGWGTGLILIVVGAFAGIWSNLMLAEMGDKYKLGNLDQVAFAAGGTKMKNLLSVCVLLYIFMSCIGYQIILCQLVGYIYASLSGNVAYTATMEFRAIVNVPVAAFIFLPLSAQRDLSALSIAGLVSICAIAYTALVLLVEMKYYNDIYKPIATIYPFYLDWNFFSSCALTFFAFTCQI
jgi:amino acid permease